jgi:hypothetical protein
MAPVPAMTAKTLIERERMNMREIMRILQIDPRPCFAIRHFLRAPGGFTSATMNAHYTPADFPMIS